MTDYYYKEKQGPVTVKDFTLTLHREDGPAVENMYKKEWWCEGKLHRDGAPAIIIRKGKIEESVYYQHGKKHRLDGPAEIYSSEEGVGFSYYVNDISHKEDGPSCISYHDKEMKLIASEDYYLNGVPRSFLPYYITYDRDGKITLEAFFYPENFSSQKPMMKKFKNGQLVSEFWGTEWDHFHRDDGPALIYYQNGKISGLSWLKDGKMHREGGYAIKTNYNEKGTKTSEYFSVTVPVFDGGAHERSYHHGSGKVYTLIWRDKMNRYHREDGPAIMIFNENGSIKKEKWYLEGKEIKK